MDAGREKREDESVNQQIRAREEIQKADEMELKAIVKRHPYSAGIAVAALKASGFTKTSPIIDMPKSKQARSYQDREDKKRLKTGSLVEEIASQYDVSVELVIKVQKIGDLKLNEITDNLLAKIEPGTCSKSNVRSMFTRQAKKDKPVNNKDLALHMLEKATGLNSSTPLSGELRVWPRLIELAVRLNTARFRPVADLTMMPYPDFDRQDGCYEQHLDAGGVSVSIRLIGGQSKLKIDKAVFPEGLDLALVLLQLNFSFERCAFWAPGYTDFNANGPKICNFYKDKKFLTPHCASTHPGRFL